MTNTTTTETPTEAELSAVAYRDGREAGEAAATWVEDMSFDDAVALHTDCDPMVEDHYAPSAPLSGEWAEFDWEVDEDDEPEVTMRDSIVDAWERGYYEAFRDEVGKMAYSILIANFFYHLTPGRSDWYR